MVYIAEAHPVDEWWGESENHSVCYRQPRTIEQRMAIAKDFVASVEPEGRMVVDTMTDEADIKYDALPERLYIVDGDKKIVYVGWEGPFGHDVEECEFYLRRHLEKKSH